MTELERNKKYSPEEKYRQLEEKGFRYPNLQRFTYHGFLVISTSKIGRGFQLYFYKERQLVEIRHMTWKDNIRTYTERYIDQCLSKKLRS